jgi:hypothetical protein
MKVTSRLVADIAPEVKQQLKDMAQAKGVSMTDILVQLIEEAHAVKYGEKEVIGNAK